MSDSERFVNAYQSEKPKLLARLRAAGKTLEEAEDLVHDVYAETLERLAEAIPGSPVLDRRLTLFNP
jgi:DNA-directed RNA polymerase specialized sigma24 family protein